MSSIGFSSFTPSNVTQIESTARTGPAQANPAPAPEEDTVQLSAAAQAQAMHQSGQSVSSIASSLGTSVSIVDSYLGITASVSVPLTAAPAAHAASAAKTVPAAPASTAPAPTAKVSTDTPKVAVKICWGGQDSCSDRPQTRLRPSDRLSDPR